MQKVNPAKADRSPQETAFVEATEALNTAKEAGHTPEELAEATRVLEAAQAALSTE